MMTILVALVVILAIIAVAKLARVYELTSELQNNKEEEIPVKDHRFNAGMLLGFLIFIFVFFIWQVYEFGDHLLPEAASEHGVALDDLLNFNWIIVISVFVLTQTLLFWFAFKYYWRPDRKARWFPHNNKLEMIWTVVPALFLAVIIIYGLKVWNDITDTEVSDDALRIELYSKQFDWTARYAGEDGQLGQANYNLISGTNPTGLYTADVVQAQIEELGGQIAEIKRQLEEDILPDNIMKELEAKKTRLQHHKDRVVKMIGVPLKDASDDISVKGEFHLPLGREVKFIFRSQDVIHSAYMPHFRAQMNTVPGMPTSLTMIPTITTAEMREKVGNPEFQYMLMCNKICGAAHFNMKMEIIVETPEEYEAWLKEQKSFVPKEVPVATDVAPSEGEPADSTISQDNLVIQLN